jgi:WD40 repeat protein
MVYVQTRSSPYDIWRVPGRHRAPHDRTPEKLIASSENDNYATYSPDGRKIAFVSRRSGVPNIWVCDSDGSNPVRLTDFKVAAGSPRWSPDGRRLVFDSNEKGDWNLYVIDVEGGVARQLSHDPTDENMPSWSRDGRWIYFQAGSSGRTQIWKMPAEGGAGVQLTNGGGGAPREAGGFVYYNKSGPLPSPVWRVPANGGQETEVVAEPAMMAEPGRDGLYLPRRQPLVRGQSWAIEYLDFGSGRSTELFRKDGPFGYVHRVDISPDEEWVLYSVHSFDTSELMLVENFR